MPPPEYRPWRMTGQTRRDLTSRMDEGMYAGVADGTSADDALAQAGRDRLLQQMSGTTDKSSREWKNARDNLSRYRRGARHPGSANQRRMRAAAEGARRDQIRATGRAKVTLNATVRTSSKTWGYADQTLTGPQLDDFLDARAAADDELAAKIVFDAYGMDPEVIVSIENIEGFDINW